MDEQFDAYYELLAIPPEEQPPNHYRLLGVNLFEGNRQVVTNAAMQRSKFLRSLGISQYAEICQKLLNDVVAAKICLLDEKKKAAYDAALAAHLKPPAAKPAAEQPVAAKPAAAKPAAAKPASSRPAGSERSKPTAMPRDGTIMLPSKSPLAKAKPPDGAGGQSPSSASVPPPPVRPAAKLRSPESAKTPAAVELPKPKAPPPEPIVLQQWVIGRNAEVDVLVDAPVVSGIHCRLTKTDDGRFWLEDLASANGTYVNRLPIAGKVPVTRNDKITLGKRTVLPWPEDAK